MFLNHGTQLDDIWNYPDVPKQTFIHAKEYKHVNMNSYKQTYISAHSHTHIHLYISANFHTFMHTFIQKNTKTQFESSKTTHKEFKMEMNIGGWCARCQRARHIDAI